MNHAHRHRDEGSCGRRGPSPGDTDTDTDTDEFASDEPWGDRTGELARMGAACGDGELGRAVFSGNAAALYG